MKHTYYLILMILMLTACNNEVITEGTVFKKEFKSAGNDIKTEQQTRVRNRGRSSVTITKTFRVTYPDRWVIYIQAGADTVDFFVNKDIYDSVKAGSWFVFDTTMGTFDEPYKRVK